MKEKLLALLDVLCSFLAYVFARRVIEDAKDPDSQHDFGRNVIPAMVGQDRVIAYSFRDENKKLAKYWRDIGTLDAYYEASMDLVAVDPQINLYDSNWPIRTYYPPLPPAKTVFEEHGSNRGGCPSAPSSPAGALSAGGGCIAPSYLPT